MKEFDQLLEIIKRLRNECPWDRKQTFISLTKHLLEESYEYIDAVQAEDDENMSEELGDVLLQVLLNSQIASETKIFDIKTVIHKLSEKMIERHPHIFGEAKAETADEVKENWEKIKAKSKPEKKSLLENIPKSMPALRKSQEIQEKVAKVGFDFENIADTFKKVEEEILELKEELSSENIEKQREEFGDLLFSMANLGRKLGFDVEASLNDANQKFSTRFNFIESHFSSSEEMKKSSLEELDEFWEKSKKINK
jgi:tetrapyrrole methylase family protein/MazG family protein